MKLSIVIPTKNEETLLPKLLSSVRSQSFQDYEIIVADAISTDKTRPVAASFGARVVDGAMPGPGRNRGAEAATGEFIAFFDADVVLPHVDFLRDCVDEMAEKSFDVATCRVHAHEGSTIDQALHSVYNAYTIATEKFLPHAPGFCLFVKRSAHEDIRGFDEEVIFAEDMDYVRRAKKAGWHFGIMRRHKIPVSVRRLDKDGRMSLAMKYVYTELHMLALGPFKHRTPFEYEFANFKRNGRDKS